jgi:hypothetical protein
MMETEEEKDKLAEDDKITDIKVSSPVDEVKKSDEPEAKDDKAITAETVANPDTEVKVEEKTEE